MTFQTGAEMDLYEHQARQLFEEHGILVPRAEVTDSPKEAREIARGLGGRCVVKAQVKTGGRGKAGGVALAADPAAAELTARQILGMDIKGHTVRTVMLAQPVDIETEFYVSYVLDRGAGRFLAIASVEGGMDIEEVAASRPDAVARVPIDPAEGVTSAKAAEITEAAGLPPQTVDALVRLWGVLEREDAVLVEVNPLVQDPGRDGYWPSTARSPWTTTQVSGRRVGATAARRTTTRWRRAAAAKGLDYVKLDGEVGIIGNGAGLVMSTLDVVAGCGARPANFLDIGGGALRPDHGRRAVGHPLGPGGDVRLRQRLRRDHRLRRRRRRHRPGPGQRCG
ncbi:Succinate--CoA ligase [ADP-forming] subunit beta OS=Streptomyces alboniger OX=132473 GN=sucC PE=3 SV=1 [Streptomyces alboniger]